MSKPVTAVILSWEELNTIVVSLQRMSLEPNISEIYVVDNGSNDRTLDFLEYASIALQGKLKYIRLSENAGPSHARNIVLDFIKTEEVFFLDGDIVYVPNTIKVYSDIYSALVKEYKKVLCVGYNDHLRVIKTGHYGAESLDTADKEMPSTGHISNWFPMAWTQYGLFNVEFLRWKKFVTTGVFGEAGHGYEDDWLFNEAFTSNYLSFSVAAPYYYHDAHKGLRNLEKYNQPSKTNERGALFHKYWDKVLGTKDCGWREKIAQLNSDQMRPMYYYSYKSDTNEIDLIKMSNAKVVSCNLYRGDDDD